MFVTVRVMVFVSPASIRLVAKLFASHSTGSTFVVSTTTGFVTGGWGSPAKLIHDVFVAFVHVDVLAPMLILVFRATVVTYRSKLLFAGSLSPTVTVLLLNTNTTFVGVDTTPRGPPSVPP